MKTSVVSWSEKTFCRLRLATLVVMFGAVLIGNVQLAHAEPVTGSDLASLAMIEAATDTFDYLPRFFGTDLKPVRFTSHMDSSGDFSFATVAGSTYNGLPLALSVAGTVSAPFSWNWTTGGAIGGMQLDMKGGNDFIHLFGEIYAGTDHDSWTPQGSNTEEDIESYVIFRVVQAVPEDIFGIYIHTTNGTWVNISFDRSTIFKDTQGPEHWNFDFSHPGEGAHQFDGGGSIDSSGNGTFVIGVHQAATPEPSSLFLLGSGILGLGGLLRRRREVRGRRSRSS